MEDPGKVRRGSRERRGSIESQEGSNDSGESPEIVKRGSKESQENVKRESGEGPKRTRRGAI